MSDPVTTSLFAFVECHVGLVEDILDRRNITREAGYANTGSRADTCAIHVERGIGYRFDG